MDSLCKYQEDRTAVFGVIPAFTEKRQKMGQYRTGGVLFCSSNTYKSMRKEIQNKDTPDII